MKKANCIRSWFPSPCRNCSVGFSWRVGQTCPLQTSAPRQNCLLTHPSWLNALLVLFSSIQLTNFPQSKQAQWKAAARAVGWAGGMGGASKQSYHQTTDHHSSGKNQLWEALCQYACIQESIWTSWSVFLLESMTVKSQGFSSVVF